jgi:histidine triad (HIT) family protein
MVVAVGRWWPARRDGRVQPVVRKAGWLRLVVVIAQMADQAAWRVIWGVGGASPGRASGMLSPMEACVFCEVVAGRRDQGVIAYQDEEVVVFPSVHQRPTNQGHMLVVTSSHFRNLYDLPPALDANFLGCVRWIAQTVQQAFHASGTTIRQNNEPPGQDVFHLHLHVMPRHLDDGNLSAAYERVDLATRIEQARELARLIERR